uniref:Ig-like domain-containing protein n=1 Tax=Chrysemys picta bellii TaxID=8478 RepID=A0A8C3IYD5_CHRPI
GTVSVPCHYGKTAQGSPKYWCRGAQWNSCSKVVETERSEVKVKRGRVSITDNHSTSTFTVTTENLNLEDAGIYWCGINIKGGDDPYSLVNVTVLPAVPSPNPTARTPQATKQPDSPPPTKTESRFSPTAYIAPPR